MENKRGHERDRSNWDRRGPDSLADRAEWEESAWEQDAVAIRSDDSKKIGFTG